MSTAQVLLLAERLSQQLRVALPAANGRTRPQGLRVQHDLKVALHRYREAATQHEMHARAAQVAKTTQSALRVPARIAALLSTDDAVFVPEFLRAVPGYSAAVRAAALALYQGQSVAPALQTQAAALLAQAGETTDETRAELVEHVIAEIEAICVGLESPARFAERRAPEGRRGDEDANA
jgi:hypothetical protein